MLFVILVDFCCCIGLYVGSCLCSNIHLKYYITGQYCITICHSKQLQEGLMVFSDDSLHFLKIKKKIVEFTKTILWL